MGRRAKSSSRAAILAFVILIGGSAVAAAQESVLYSFKGGRDGAVPNSGLVMGADGNLYGTTGSGGKHRSCRGGCGTVFALSPPSAGQIAWTEIVIHRFRGEAVGGTQGPAAGVTMGAGGVLYGTTAGSGSGSGAVFALQPPAVGETRWAERLLYVFSGGKDGAKPYSGLIMGAGGVLYGTTFVGGNSACGCGSVFALMPPAAGKTSWTKRVLHSFDGADGDSPTSALRMDGAGNLFGTTPFGGSRGGGTVFQLVRPGLGETRWSHRLLHSFGISKHHDGAVPQAGLMIDTRGVLYGTTTGGGDSGNGTVFELSPPAAGETRWTETVLYSFKGGNDGRFPLAELIIDTRGVLYGTTNRGGDSDNGTVFELSPPAAGETQWTERVLYRFKGTNDGALPGDLIMDPNGVLYGTTFGTYDHGAVFAVQPPAVGETLWTETVLHTNVRMPTTGRPSRPILLPIHRPSSPAATSHSPPARRMPGAAGMIGSMSRSTAKSRRSAPRSKRLARPCEIDRSGCLASRGWSSTRR
jgi:uncharacterized repeat protein (TIGR03803 family)